MQVVGTAGHVDHGKSTLVQRLTGIDPDRFAEEKRRGLTIDLGFAWLPLPSGVEIGLIDVPGHERFIRNMLAGAGGITVALFVVAANEGWRPQSAEHLAILDLLGITDGVVALTKSELVDDSELELRREEVAARLRSTSLAGAPVVACSAVTGAGLDELVTRLDDAVRSAPAPADEGRARLWVDRVFTIAGAGTVVTGTLTGGRFATGDEVEVLPERPKARIRSIQSHKKQIAEVGPGNRVALNLVGIDRTGARRGNALVHPGSWTATRLVDVELRVVDPRVSGTDQPLSEKGSFLLYAGSAETPVGIRLLDRRKVEPGGAAFAQLRLRDALALKPHDRFVIRDAGRVVTLAGGTVLDPLPRPVRARDADARVDLLRALRHAAPDEALRELVVASGRIDVEEATFRSGVRTVPEDIPRLGAALVSEGEVHDLVARLHAEVDDHHRRHPLELGMPRPALQAALAIDAQSFDDLVATSADVVVEGPHVRKTTHRVDLDPARARLRDEVIQHLDAHGFQPPLAEDLQAETNLLRALADSGDIVRIGPYYLTQARAEEARRRVRAHIEEYGPVTVAEIRDLLETSRKYAVPLCEWLDATGATIRRGDVRILGPKG